jgi:hypothetical protein
MKRIYYLVPDVSTTTRIVEGLLLARIEARRIHVLARPGTPLGDLPEASFLQKTDFIPGLEQGLVIGGLTGVVTGLLALMLPMGMVLGGGTVLALTLAGAVVGAWISSMVGSSCSNRCIRQFQSAIENGELLIMIDVPRPQVEEIEAVVVKHYPAAVCKGLEPTIPAFP